MGLEDPDFVPISSVRSFSRHKPEPFPPLLHQASMWKPMVALQRLVIKLRRLLLLGGCRTYG